MKLAGLREVKAAILFGSVAKGTAGRRSDIDLLVVAAAKKVKDRVHEAMSEIQRGIERPLQVVVRTPKEFSKTDPTFMRNILQHGKLIYLAPGTELPLRRFAPGRPATVFCYDTTELDKRKRDTLRYALFGHRLRKRGKLYESRGMVEKYGGERLGKAVILVPSEHRETFEELFDGHGAKYREVHVIELGR